MTSNIFVQQVKNICYLSFKDLRVNLPGNGLWDWVMVQSKVRTETVYSD